MTPNSQPDDHSRRQFMRRTGATLATVGGLSLYSTTAAADEDDEPGRFALLWASARGRTSSMYERYFGERSDAEAAAIAAQQEFNANADAWVDYLNTHASLSSDIEVIALEFVPDPEDGETYTVYLIGEYNSDDELTAADVVDETERDPDETVRLESIAADNAADEIETGYEDYVAEDNPPDDEHLAYLAGRYRFGTAHITTTLLGDDL